MLYTQHKSLLINTLKAEQCLRNQYKAPLEATYIIDLSSRSIMHATMRKVESVGNNGENDWNYFWLKMLEIVFDRKLTWHIWKKWKYRKIN